MYAFVIETNGGNAKDWRYAEHYAGECRGVEDNAGGDPGDFAQATLDAFLDRMVAERPDMAEYYLCEDDEETAWRIRVWDVAELLIGGYGYQGMNPVPAPACLERRTYAHGIAINGYEPDSTVTLSALDVQHRLRAKLLPETG